MEKQQQPRPQRSNSKLLIGGLIIGGIVILMIVVARLLLFKKKSEYFYIASAEDVQKVMTWNPRTKFLSMTDRIKGEDQNQLFKFTAECNGYAKIKCKADNINFLHWNGLSVEKELAIGRARPGLDDDFTDFKIINKDGSTRIECRQKVDNVTHTVVWSYSKGIMTTTDPSQSDVYSNFKLVYL